MPFVEEIKRGCLAELNNAEIGLPGCTAFWNSFSCWAMLVVMLCFALLAPRLLFTPETAVEFCVAAGKEIFVT